MKTFANLQPAEPDKFYSLSKQFRPPRLCDHFSLVKVQVITLCKQVVWLHETTKFALKPPNNSSRPFAATGWVGDQLASFRHLLYSYWPTYASKYSSILAQYFLSCRENLWKK